MANRFTAMLILVNLIAELFLYLSTQAMLIHLSSNHLTFTLTGVDVDKVFIGAVQSSSSSTPLVIASYPNYPSYFLWLPLALNIALIISVIGRRARRNGFMIFSIGANITLALLMYYSIESLLLSLLPKDGVYMAIGGVNFLSFLEFYVSVAGSAIPGLVIGAGNTPSYVLLLSIFVNLVFLIKLWFSKKE